MAGNTEYKNKFISENYDRIFLTVPKGTKALIEEKAKAEGMSVNSFIISLINKEVEIRAEVNKSEKKEMEIFLF